MARGGRQVSEGDLTEEERRHKERTAKHKVVVDARIAVRAD